jgi:pyruvate-formate lyase-activating enzyme
VVYFSVPNSSHFDYYIGAYRAAEAASRVINSIDIIPADAARDNIEAQARFIRALNNFDMVSILRFLHNQLMRRHLWGCTI